MLSLFLPIICAILAVTIGYEIGYRNGLREGQWVDVTPEQFDTLVRHGIIDAE